MTRRNCLLASSMPAAHQRNAICAARQRLTLWAWSRQIEIIDSIPLVERRGAGQCRRYAETEHGEGLGESLAQAGGGTWVGLVQLAGEGLEERVGGELGVGVVGRTHATLDLRS